ncbi:energy-coupling factor transporter transmembrane component T [Neobacillus drentensis]|uniref:energy-coupling factor transporter transmembrane component T n=1 Tax=Neobacillus drentensis TaxID=220684 RepID=UPI000825DAC6|nr:energy-coupling factor transporter transmembrane component T [Neobacillus drentensis]
MEKKNVILSLYPTTKLLMILLIAVSVFIIPSYLYAYAMFLVCLVIAAMGNVTKEFANLTIKGLFSLCILIFVLQSFFYPGTHVLWEWGFLAIKQEGIHFGLTLTSKVIAVGSSLILFFRITPVKDFVYSLEVMGLSPKATYVVLSTLTIIPEMKKSSQVIMDAQKTRGVETEGSLMVRLKALLPMITPLVLSSVASTEERAMALEARAFTVNKRKTSIYSIEKTGRDSFIRVLLLVLLILLIVWRVAL